MPAAPISWSCWSPCSCLIPTTIGALLSAIGIAGMDRLCASTCSPCRAARSRRPATSMYAPARQDRDDHARQPQATEFIPAPGYRTRRTLPRRRSLRQLADETPEGRSIVVLAKEKFGARAEPADIGAHLRPVHGSDALSGIDIPTGRYARAQRLNPSRPSWISGRRVNLPPAGSCVRRDEDRQGGRHAARRRRERARAGRHPPQGHREAGHQGALRRAAAHGNQDGHDHRRQSADRRGHRGGGGRRRFPRRGDAREEARAHPRVSNRADASLP
jgi:hypothetical protein